MLAHRALGWVSDVIRAEATVKRLLLLLEPMNTPHVYASSHYYSLFELLSDKEPNFNLPPSF
jgi:hypothetical protein